MKVVIVICQYFLHCGACDFPITTLMKNFQNRVFFRLWRRDPVLDLYLVALLCVVYCVLQCSVCKSHCSGCVKVPWICQYFFFILPLVIFLSKVLLKTLRIVFFSALGRDPVLDLHLLAQSCKNFSVSKFPVSASVCGSFCV